MNTNEEKILTDYLSLLGLRVKDAVTGFAGVVTSVSFDLYGCVQAVVTPSGVDKDEKMKQGHWLDVNRLVIEDPCGVMPVPDYKPRMPSVITSAGATQAGTHGPAEKPAYEQLP